MPFQTWILTTAAALGIAGAVPLGMVAYDAFYAEERGMPPDAACSSFQGTPFTTGQLQNATSVLRVRVRNHEDAVAGRLCVFGVDAQKRFDRDVTLPAAQETVFDFQVPRGIYYARMEVPPTLVAGGSANTKWCPSGDAQVFVDITVSPGHLGGGSHSGTCGPLLGSHRGVAAQAGAAGLGVAGILFILGKWFPASALLMFTRLVRPRVLEQEVRGRVYQLVEQSPGIHASQIVRNLSASQGQAAYHLGVLVREKLLATVGLPGFRRYFVAGRFSPLEMQAMALLQSRPLQRVYQAIAEHPGQPLGLVAASSQMTRSYVSRAVRKLEASNLVERKPTGRSVLLFPVARPGDPTRPIATKNPSLVPEEAKERDEPHAS